MKSLSQLEYDNLKKLIKQLQVRITFIFIYLDLI